MERTLNVGNTVQTTKEAATISGCAPSAVSWFLIVPRLFTRRPPGSHLVSSTPPSRIRADSSHAHLTVQWWFEAPLGRYEYMVFLLGGWTLFSGTWLRAPPGLIGLQLGGGGFGFMLDALNLVRVARLFALRLCSLEGI